MTEIAMAPSAEVVVTPRPASIPSGAPTTCPSDPAAVTIPKVFERFSGLAARPATARITPNPVAAMPKPTSISKNRCCPGATA